VFTLLQRMIFMELFRVFFLCWVALTGMILLGGVIAEASQQGLGPTQILEIIPFLIPSFMPYTLPTTTLFATCVVYGRLAHDNEVLAVKAAGINLFQIVLPAVLLGGLAAGGTMALYYDVIPSTHWDLRTHFVNNIEEFIYSVLRKDGCLRHPQLDYTIHVKRVEGRDLIEPCFLRRDPKTGAYDIIARGKKAVLSVDQENDVINVLMWQSTIQKGADVYSSDDWAPPISVDMKEVKDVKKTRPTDMTWPEMADFREEFLKEIGRMNDEIARHEAVIVTGAAPPHYALHVKNLRFQVHYTQGSVANIDAEYHMRPALALGCFCFVLVGCPTGIWFSRSDYLSSFITCFLPIVVVYYPMTLCGINFAKSGKLSPALVIWPANIVLALAAVYLLRRLMRN
jgi:lipopolysaccharide export system permease protein